jgi:hypothetical protein
MEPVEPSMATPVLCMRLLRNQEGDEYFRIVGVEKIDRLAVFIDVRSCAHAPVTTIHVNEVDRCVDSLISADGFQIKRRLTVTIGDVDAARNNAAKVVYFADVRLELLIRAEEVLGFGGRFAISDLIKRDTDDSADEQSDDNDKHDNHAANCQEDLFGGHRLSVLAVQDSEVKDGEIVDERCIEEQAIQPVE